MASVNPKAFDNLNVLDLVSRRTRVSYRDIRQTVDELQRVLTALKHAEYLNEEDEALLEALSKHSDVQNYTLPTQPERRESCATVSDFVDEIEQEIKDNA